MIRAHLETRHFTFDAYGVDRERAEEALKTGWAVHIAQTDAHPWEEFSDDVCFHEFKLDAAYRDYEELKPATTGDHNDDTTENRT